MHVIYLLLLLLLYYYLLLLLFFLINHPSSHLFIRRSFTLPPIYLSI